MMISGALNEGMVFFWGRCLDLDLDLGIVGVGVGGECYGCMGLCCQEGILSYTY